jgi:hypothetical protein
MKKSHKKKEEDERLVLNSILFLQEDEDFLFQYLFDKFSFFNHEEYFPTVWMMIRELVQNAIKANAKRVFFDLKGLDPINPDEYRAGLHDFHLAIKNGIPESHLLELYRRNIYFTIDALFAKSGADFEIVNYFPLLPEENLRIREKLKIIHNYSTIYEFCIENPDEIEGAGIGIALIVSLLSGLGIDPRNFSISSDTGGERTIARIHVPFMQEIKSFMRASERSGLRQIVSKVRRISYRKGFGERRKSDSAFLRKGGIVLKKLFYPRMVF